MRNSRNANYKNIKFAKRFKNSTFDASNFSKNRSRGNRGLRGREFDPQPLGRGFKSYSFNVALSSFRCF